MSDKIDVFTASNYYISQFYYLAKRCDLDADALFEEADIDTTLVDQPGVRVSADKLSNLAQRIWDLLDDEAMSLASSKLPRGAFAMMGSLTIHEPTLKKAIFSASRFYKMVTSAYSMELVVTDELATLKCVFTAPELDAERLLSELTLMGWHRYFSWLIAENITMDTVYFHYPPPSQVEEYSYLFPGNHQFHSDFLGFSFPSRYLRAENVQNADSMKVFMQNCPAELFTQPRVDFSLSGALKRLLRRSLKHGFPTIDEAAEQMHMTKRTLIRRLAEEGAAYQKLKDAVRRDRAVYLLAKNELSINEVAEQVGFSDSAVFARAFKSWTGCSPRDYKQNNKVEEK